MKRSKGSITVEASLILPLFIVSIVTFVYIIKMFSFNESVENSLYLTANNIASDTSINSYSSTDIKNMAGKYMAESSLDNIYMRSVVNDINFSKSFYNSNNSCFEINAEYYYQLPFSLSNSIRVPVGLRISGKKYTGYIPNNEKLVYITNAGSVYHTFRDCTYLQTDVMKVNLSVVDNYRNMSGSKYRKCLLCGNGYSGEYVYISRYGTAYHEYETCSSLHHNVVAVKLSEVGSRRKCSKCSGRE